MVDLLPIAVSLVERGVSVLPIRADGTKRPAVKWNEFQERIATVDEVFGWFDGDAHGLGVVCGAVSGGLEMAEIEGRAVGRLDEISAVAAESGLLDLWDRVRAGYTERTPSGGLHWLYRVAWTPERPAAGNTRLARGRREVDATGKITYPVLTETRGEGGFVAVAPTPAECGKYGRPWEITAGGWDTLVTLTPFERDQFLALLSTVDEAGEEKMAERARREAVSAAELDAERPGDDFELRHTWAEILRDGLPELGLAAYGWEVVEVIGGGDEDDDTEPRMWVHADATNDQSASTGVAEDRNRLYVFSSSTAFEPETPYTKFGAYALLAHDGDHVAAATALGAAGYGSQGAQGPSWAELLAGGVGDPETPAQPVNAGLGGVGFVISAEPPALPPEGGPHTDMGLAARIARQEGPCLRYVADLGKWHVWDGRRWKLDETGEHVRRVMRVVRNLVNYEGTLYDTTPKGPNGDKPSEFDMFQRWALQSQSATRVRAADGLLSEWDGIAVTRKHFDADTNLLVFENGTFELDTCKLRAHVPADHMTKLIDYPFDPDAQAPTWDAFLERVLPDAEDRAFMQRAVGYTLTGQNNERAMFVLFGPAATGKSKFLDALDYALAEYASTASAATLMAKRNESDGPNPGLRAFEGPRLITISETNRVQAWDEALVKRITGGDAITTRALYMDMATFRPTGIMWMATNSKPNVTGDDGAIYTRMQMMPFREEIPLEEQDKHLNDKLKEERAGIMAWAIRGLRMYQAEGLNPSPNSIKELESYQEEQNPVAGFLDECTEPGHIVDSFASIKRLWAAYRVYCTNEQMPLFRKGRFIAQLEAMGYSKGKARESGQEPVSGFETNGSVPGFYGIKVTGDLETVSRRWP